MYLFWIGVGGALGSIARFLCSEAALRLWGPSFPWGTLLVNALGSFLIGIFASMFPATGSEGSNLVKQFLVVGICGGYTTFSSFSLQTLALLQNGNIGKAFLNVVGSVVVCLIATWVGMKIGGR